MFRSKLNADLQGSQVRLWIAQGNDLARVMFCHAVHQVAR